jgi:hypothetical protein
MNTRKPKSERSKRLISESVRRRHAERRLLESLTVEYAAKLPIGKTPDDAGLLAYAKNRGGYFSGKGNHRIHQQLQEEFAKSKERIERQCGKSLNIGEDLSLWIATVVKLQTPKNQ